MTPSPLAQRVRSAIPHHPTPRLLGVLTVMVAFGVGPATPISAQVQDDPPQQQQEAQPRLGDELHPPTSYSTDVDDGIVPIGNYDIGCANDGFIVDVGCAILGTATSTFFSIGSAIVAVSVWLLAAATSFTLEDALGDTATTIADLLDTRFLGPMRIAHLGLVASALYMGWQFLRGRIGVGAGEYAISLVVLAVLIHVSTGPGFGAAVSATTHTAGGISGEIVTLAAGTDGTGEVGDRVGAALMAGFVRDPYDVINWGRLLSGTGCEAARNQALQAGPHGVDDYPRQLMEEAGCHAEAEYNREASGGRLIGAILHVVVAIAALVLLLITALTLVVAKGMTLFLIALLPVALYAGLFPGAGQVRFATGFRHWNPETKGPALAVKDPDMLPGPPLGSREMNSDK